ncbi:unnamed protein product, partial [Dovyalis caffra]
HNKLPSFGGGWASLSPSGVNHTHRRFIDPTTCGDDGGNNKFDPKSDTTCRLLQHQLADHSCTSLIEHRARTKSLPLIVEEVIASMTSEYLVFHGRASHKVLEEAMLGKQGNASP